MDHMMENGRVPANPLRLRMNFTTSTSDDPLLNATSVSCSLSKVLNENYQRDLVLQEEQNEFVEVDEKMRNLTKLIDFWVETTEGLAAFRPPAPPPPPLLPPPEPAPPGGVVGPGPPAPPALVDFRTRIRQLRQELSVLEVRRDALLAEITGCVPSRTHACGRSSIEAPHPWIAEDGTHCRGFDTLETRTGDYCSFWKSEVNLDGASTDERRDLIAAGGSCLSSDGEELRCSPRADRLARSGAYELKEFLRVDRRYAEHELFRSRAIASNTWTAADAREQIAFRNFSCYTEQCSLCAARCTNEAARTVASVVRCTLGNSFISTISCGFQSDAGQRIRAMHGARRSKSREGNPENIFEEHYMSCVQNDNGTIARDAISCRKPTLASPEGIFTPGFDDRGDPISRSVGHIVTCRTDSDCFQRCPPAHPLHGTPYVCQKNYYLYDYLEITEDGNFMRQMENADAFDPDPIQQAITGEYGICVVRLI